MSQIRFQSYSRDELGLRLHGTFYQARISALGQGIWRILVYHRPEDSHKSSWVMEGPPPIDFDWESSGNSLCLHQPESELHLHLAPFNLEWQNLSSFGLHTEAVKSLLQALPQPHSEPHDFLEHPVRDKLDGLPLGSGLTLELDLKAGDGFYGLGERTGFLNKRGRRWQNWTTDEFLHLPKADPLYQAHPYVLLEQQGQYSGVYLDESWFSSFDLGFTVPDQWSIHTAGPTFDLYLIPGPDPRDVVQRLTGLLGRAPMPPLWALGNHQCRWSYPDQQVALEVARQYRQHQMPLDVLWLDIDYMDSYKVFSFSSSRFPNPLAFHQSLNELGLRSVAIVDPAVKITEDYALYTQGQDLSAWIRNHKDENLIGAVWPEPVVWPDFSQQSVRDWWGEAHQFYLDRGVSGIWNDMNEPAAFHWPGKTLPLDARQGAYTHAELHNLYGYQMCQATFEGLKQLQPDKRPFVLTRSGFSGIQKYAWVWTGDNASYWEHLEMSVPMLLNLGLSGVPFIGADIGGFSDDCDGELLTAWTWLGICYPFMRNHSGKRSRRQEPWQFGTPWDEQIRQALEWRYRLLPYLYTLAYQACQDGLPVMRPLMLIYPQDTQVRHLHDQFMLGNDLLVAPVTRPGQSHRQVYLPDGTWEDFWTGQRFQGPQWLCIPVSVARIPLFQRAGSAIPLAPVQQHTTDAWWHQLTWRIALAETIWGQVYCDAGDGPVDGELISLEGEWQTSQIQLARTADQRQVWVQILGTGSNPTEALYPMPKTKLILDGPN